MKKIIIAIAVIAAVALGSVIYKKYYCPSCSSIIISEEPLAYTPEVEHKFLLARNAAQAFKETGIAPKLA